MSTSPMAAQTTVLAAWRETLGERAWVLPREQAIAAGWFGERVADDVGHASAMSWGRSWFGRGGAPKVEPLESSLIGHHGSLTSAEQRVPLLLAYG